MTNQQGCRKATPRIRFQGCCAAHQKTNVVSVACCFFDGSLDYILTAGSPWRVHEELAYTWHGICVTLFAVQAWWRSNNWAVSPQTTLCETLAGPQSRDGLGQKQGPAHCIADKRYHVKMQGVEMFVFGAPCLALWVGIGRQRGT